ncbi:hypothetical protein DVH24_021028 [Malus domestica]|uniref:Uncharacterized protein n=1 Tax=Malus domestica TaxID=3750 RepID=A0A498JAY4_MALDO|nr:hypothetical protein DVH24_021028 [Malus domestica]
MVRAVEGEFKVKRRGDHLGEVFFVELLENGHSVSQGGSFGLPFQNVEEVIEIKLIKTLFDNFGI